MTGAPGEPATVRVAARWRVRLAGAVPGGTGPDARRHQRAGQVLLGLTWVADGVLQLQPYMFGKGFVTGVLAPAAQGNPVPVAHSVTATASFLEAHIAVWNVLFAVTQLAIGAGLLLPAAVKPALAASFAWSLAVWWFGEGLGGLLTPAASPLAGAPGAVLLYLYAGLLLWPRRSAGRYGLLGQAGARVSWLVLWAGLAALAAEPANLTSGALSQAISAAAAGQPGWLGGAMLGAAQAVAPAGPAWTVLLAVVCLAVGLGVALRFHEGAFLALAVAVATAIWVLGEGLGGILTGRGTDPSTGPLLALAAFVLWEERTAKRSEEGAGVLSLEGGKA